MRYFNDVLKTIDYNGNTVINIFKNIDFDILKNESFLDDYSIKDGDTPRSLAQDLYGDVNLSWIIMIVNRIHNVFFDFPITDRVATIVKSDMALMGYTPTEIDTFESENDTKRFIKILKPEFLQSFLFQLKDKVDGK